jgi:hypothetical protein
MSPGGGPPGPSDCAQTAQQLAASTPAINNARRACKYLYAISIMKLLSTNKSAMIALLALKIVGSAPVSALIASASKPWFLPQGSSISRDAHSDRRTVAGFR